MHKFVRPMIAAACLLGGATSAHAEGVTVTVPHGDLDLTSADDVAVLQDRLRAAIRDACRVLGNRGLTAGMEDSACVADGMGRGLKIIAEHRERALEAAPD